MARKQADLYGYLHKNFYNHYRVKRMRTKGHRFVREMFVTLMDDTGQLDRTWQSWAATEGSERAVCDYIAGMTDREALQEYRRLFHPDTGTM